MTLDILHFIDTKGGNSQEIRESQKKRGLSTDIVDEVQGMYAEWIKSEWSPSLNHKLELVSYWTKNLYSGL